MTEKELRIPLNNPLNELDTEEQTFGCRATNPSICSHNYMQKVCAFVTDDHICLCLSKAWKKKYIELKSAK